MLLAAGLLGAMLDPIMLIAMGLLGFVSRQWFHVAVGAAFMGAIAAGLASREDSDGISETLAFVAAQADGFLFFVLFRALAKRRWPRPAKPSVAAKPDRIDPPHL